MLRKGTDSDKLWEKNSFRLCSSSISDTITPFFPLSLFDSDSAQPAVSYFPPHTHSLPQSFLHQHPLNPNMQPNSAPRGRSLYLISTSHTYVYKERVEALKAHTRSWWSFIWSSKVQKSGIPPKLHIEPLKDEIVTCEKASIHDMVGDSWSKVSATVLLQWQR